MSRAVAIDAALIGGPNHGRRAPSGSAGELLGERGPAGPPARQQPLRRLPARPAAAASSTTRGQGRCRRRPPARREALGVGGGEQRLVVGPGQVRDLVGDRPALGRGRGQPGGVLELGDHAVERVALGPQVGEQRGQQLVRSATPTSARPGDAAGSAARTYGRGPCPGQATPGRAGSAPVLLDAALLSTGFDDVAATARDVEARGYAGVWASEVDHDPFLQLLAAGQATERLQVGTAIAVAFARSPMTLAHTAHDLQRYTRGRFVLGLGTQIKAHVERRFSMPWTAPAARMREYIGGAARHLERLAAQARRCASRASTTGTR